MTEPAAPQPEEPLPEATLQLLVAEHATRAMIALGVVGPKEGEPPVLRPRMAQLEIDLLQILYDKTRGNLTGEEETFLRNTLQELHLLFARRAGSEGAEPTAKT